MIIGACGYGGTGSSAAVDFLKEFDCVQTLTRAEAQYAFKVDGLQDLEYHLVKQYSRQMSGDQAIARFLYAAKYAKTPIVKRIVKSPKEYLRITQEYADSLVQATWQGIDNADYETGNLLKSMAVLVFKKIIIPFYEKHTGKLYNAWPMRKMYLSIEPEEFYEKTRKYTHNLLKAAGADFKKMIVMDQPFEGNAPWQSFPFYDNPKAIVIDRDPRALYLAASYQWPKDGTFMPRRDPEAFVQYFKQQRKYQKELNDHKNVLFLRLEDMIFDYDKSAKKIMDFVGLKKEHHKTKFKYFKPDLSIKGTQLYKKMPGHEKELEYIEKELSDFYFPFEDYKKAEKNNELFYID